MSVSRSNTEHGSRASSRRSASSSTRALTVLALVLVIASAAVVSWLWRERNREAEVPILMYHKIGAGDSRWWVHPRQFESHLRFLRDEGYRAILPSDLAANRRWGRPLPPRPVIITFDDGYRNALTEAEPLLKKYGFRGVVYLVTGLVGADDGSRKTQAGAPCLTWPEVRAMHGRGTITFGGHTRSHVNLVALADPFGEIRACYEDIEEYGGFAPDSFCYPYGQYRPETARAVRRAGFACALICSDDVAQWSAATDLFQLPRVSVIGGARSFTARQLESGPEAEMAFRVGYEGIPMEVSPRLNWGPHREDGMWFESRLLLPVTAIDVSWDAPVPLDLRGSAQLEVWDRNRVLRLFPLTG